MTQKRRVVLKVGSSNISDGEQILRERLKKLCGLIDDLRREFSVILVSSAAVASGYTRLKIDRTKMSHKQALAAIGQPFLMKAYSDILERYNILCAQLLLSRHTFDSRRECGFARATIDALLEHGVLPIINENDPVDVAEFSIGDNDRLSAFAAHYFDAEMLVIFSDIDGYFDADPRVDATAKVRSLVEHLSQAELSGSSVGSGDFATGGITTKLLAADFLMKKGRSMFLCNGADLSVARDFLLDGFQRSGTLFRAKTND